MVPRGVDNNLFLVERRSRPKRVQEKKKHLTGFFSLELITKEKTRLITLIRLTAVISWFKQRHLPRVRPSILAFISEDMSVRCFFKD